MKFRILSPNYGNILFNKNNAFKMQKLYISSIEYEKKIKKCYAVLCIKEGSDQETVRRAYLDLAKRFHPDSGSAEADGDKFRQVEDAFRTLNKKNAQDRWGVSESKQAKVFDIKHTAPQHRQYLSYEGTGSGTPAQREKQWAKNRAARAAQNVMEHRVAKASASEGALLDKNAPKKLKHDIKTKYGFDRLVEDLIQESMSKGDFSNLSGSGKPLPLHQKTNPYVDFVTHKMNQVLIDNGFTPEWITLQKDIRLQLECFRNSLLNERTSLGPVPLTDAEQIIWSKIKEKHEEMVKQINSKITHYNLIVSILQKQMFLVMLQKESDETLEKGMNKTQLPPVPPKVEVKSYDVSNEKHQNVMSLLFSIFKL